MLQVSVYQNSYMKGETLLRLPCVQPAREAQRIVRPFYLARQSTMYLHYYLDEENKRVYTFKKTDPNGVPTIPAHPARYSVGNEMSKERILIKKRFNILPTQRPPPVY